MNDAIKEHKMRLKAAARLNNGNTQRKRDRRKSNVWVLEGKVDGGGGGRGGSESIQGSSFRFVFH